MRKFIGQLLPFLVLTIATLYSVDLQALSPKSKTVLLAVLPQDKDYLLPKYLQHIDDLDYNKKLITVYVNIPIEVNENREILENWAIKNRELYRDIIIEQSNGRMNTRRKRSLQKAAETQSDFYFTVDTQVFITPCTLRELIRRDKPIISPLLHAIPELNDTSSNFSTYTTNYLSIVNRAIKGTFKVPAVQMAYLIKTSVIDSLEFNDEDESTIFSRKNGLDQFICNE